MNVSKNTSSTSMPKVSQEALLTSLPLPLATVLLSSCAPAYADEAAEIMAKNSGFLGYTNGGLVVAFSPIVVYAVFYLYRATINPKAKLQDLLFVAAFCVVVANLVSITVFHKRVY
jgi:Co/Zn/Cd efflux system component